MGDLKSLFDALYSRFLLRDLFGKTIPGLMLLFFAGTVSADAESALNFFSKLTFFSWLVVIGVGWITGFAIQSAGEWFKLILYYPKNISDIIHPSRCLAKSIFNEVPREEFVLSEFEKCIKQVGKKSNVQMKEYIFKNDQSWYQFQTKYNEAVECDDAAKQNRERIIVIKETCGNAYLSLLISLIFILFIWLKVDWSTFLVLTFLALFGIVLLCRMHFIHVFRQYQIEQESIRDWASKGYLTNARTSTS